MLDDIVYTLGPRPFFILEYPTIMAAAICYGELSYAVAGLTGTNHLRYYRYIVAITSGLWFFWFIYVVFILQPPSYTEPEFGILSLLPIILFCWPIVIFTVNLRRSGITGLRKLNLNSVHDDSQKATIGFLWGTLLRVVSSAFPILLWLYPDLSWEIVYGIFFANNLLIVSVMVLTYFNYIEKRANLASKITSILSVMLLIAVSAVVIALFSEGQEMRSRDTAFLRQNSLHARPVSSGYDLKLSPSHDIRQDTKLLSSKPGVQPLQLPFSFPFFGKEYDDVFVYSDGQVAMATPEETSKPSLDQYFCEQARPAISVFCSPDQHYQTYIKLASDEVVIVWQSQIPSITQPRNNAKFQLVLKPSGDMVLSYGSLPEKVATKRHNAIGFHRRNFSLPHRGAELNQMPLSVEGDGVWFDLGISRRQVLHAGMLPVALFLLAMVVIILLFFRPYLERLIVEPLENIQRGLGRVNEGRLDHGIRVHTRDEFADIAVGFNKMVASLEVARQRQDEQTELMESELTQRIVEVAKSIDRDLLSKDQVFEQKLRDTIEENLGNPDFQVAELADALATSTRQLHRRVVNLTAQTPAALIRHLRLEYGHQLLSAKAATVSEAAYKVGFRDVSYFARLFQKKYGQSPSELLKS